MSANTTKLRTESIAEWANWATNAPREVYSQLYLPTNSTNPSFMASSIDTKVIPQSEAMLERFRDMQERAVKRNRFGLGRKENGSAKLPLSWERVPGFDDLRSNKICSPTKNKHHFRMLRYADELQAHNAQLCKAGNMFLSFKFVKHLDADIIQLLTEATTGKISPKNESQIQIVSAGGAVADVPKDCVAFDFRDCNFAIYIVGRWDNTENASRDYRERERVIAWVQLVANKLNSSDQVRSTAHPESTRDLVSKSGRTKPGPGWYNFTKGNGTKLEEIKKARDPRNVFSLASRVSWDNHHDSRHSRHYTRRHSGHHNNNNNNTTTTRQRRRSSSLPATKRDTTTISTTTSSSPSRTTSSSCTDDSYLTSTSGSATSEESMMEMPTTPQEDVENWSVTPSMILDSDYFEFDDDDDEGIDADDDDSYRDD
eukprot:CAMPEP_0118713502 /NCGR_PEP_ID=MMETSP0800-20121206/25554_1 /TAXON_ID=210618 ORGANISM="Striatella unipunctata, Strain CCMP2910" /NCGR_SAMPLE_ID=MMETSP0800 /ASSEMBLY_ACC=CAM_ASM_000638 /LENGTH=427 /DNA_ID=CAMNT_0006618965 /DNA_START=72 /DNA_END=1355 /DNA_ORIENTATION=+